MLEACRPLNGCATGDAKITPGFKLPAKYVIHTVGPVYHGGDTEATQLASCYRRSFKVALKNDVKSIAFPAISTGVYGYPKDEAARIAIGVMREFEDRFERVTACLHSEGDLILYQNILKTS